jgi:mono/diheme cytochrome c family protein
LKRRERLALIVVAVAAGSLAWATGLVSLPWNHDMDRQISIKPQEMPLLPPDGTVAITGRIDDGDRAGVDRLVNTVAADDTTALRQGRLAYGTYCTPCHGAKGVGDGPVARALPIPPVDLTRADLMSARSDGSLYYTIRHGNVIMPGYAYALTPEQSWAVVRYVRTLRTP